MLVERKFQFHLNHGDCVPVRYCGSRSFFRFVKRTVARKPLVGTTGGGHQNELVSRRAVLQISHIPQ